MTDEKKEVKKPAQAAKKDGAKKEPAKKDSPKKAELEALKAELEAGKAELARVSDLLLRTTAEYDNYRKRTANEKLGIYDDATSKAVTEILPVADSMRMALENLKDSDPEIIKGVELIKSQLDRSFEKLKIESYGEVGDEFDPNLHNAISMVDSEELKSNQIAAVFQTGYKIGDKIIRHAMVQVVN